MITAQASDSPSPHILMTRAAEDCAGFAAQLAPMAGMVEYYAPFVTRHLPIEPAMLDQLQREAAAPDSALVLTSPRSLQALAATAPQLVQAWRQQPVFCVGDGTAAAAAALGFSQVDSAAGDGAALAARLSLVGPQRQIRHFWHLSGVVTAVDLAAPLQAVQLRVTRVPLYSADLAEPVPQDLAARLVRGEITDVVLLSARVAAQLGQIARAGGGPGPQRLWCLSARIAEAARSAFAPLAPLITASAQPDIAQLLALVQTAVAAQKAMHSKDLPAKD